MVRGMGIAGSVLVLILTLSGCGRVRSANFGDGNQRVQQKPLAILTAPAPYIANGFDVGRVRVTLLNPDGSPMVGVRPTLKINGSVVEQGTTVNGDMVGCGTTDATGISNCTLTSSVAGTKLVALADPPASALAIPVEVLETTTFRYTWNVPTPGDTATLPLLEGMTYNVRIFWGDGQTSTLNGIPTAQTRTHTYAEAGEKVIWISGIFSALRFAWNPERLLDVTFWGSQPFTDMGGMFQNCVKLRTFSAPFPPDTSSVGRFTSVFEGATEFNGAVNDWDVSSATTMNRMFKGAISFDQPLHSWNVSSVIDFGEMFASGSAPESPELFESVPGPVDPMIFNQDIGNWNTSSATSFRKMFAGATLFNQNLGNWNTANVTDMSMMFYYATGFMNGGDSSAQPGLRTIENSWNVSNVGTMEGMFMHAESFNASLSGWTGTQLLSLRRTFAYATAFNQDLSSWMTPELTDLSETFFQASSFNSPVFSYVRKVGDFTRTFAHATQFNQDLSGWEPGGVPSPSSVSMAGMFEDAQSFNQDLSNWSMYLDHVTDMSFMFKDAVLFNNGRTSMVIMDAPLVWNRAQPVTLKSMFARAQAFDNTLVFRTDNVVDMSFMFMGASSYNRQMQSSASQWDVSRVQSMYGMFWGASAFAQDLLGAGMWTVGSVLDSIYFDTLTPSWLDNWKPFVSGGSVAPFANPRRVFVTASVYTGDLGGKAGADQKCMADANKPNDALTYQAVLVTADRALYPTPSDWAIAPATRYYRDAGLVTTAFEQGKFHRIFDHPFSDTPVRYWTGLNNDWTSSSVNCSDWTSAGVGQVGLTNSSHTWDATVANCSEMKALLCVSH